MSRLLLLILASCAWSAELSVSKIWSRATVAGQEAGAVFATITAGSTADRLQSASSAIAAVVEVHEHAAGADGVVQMRAVIDGVAIGAGSTVELKPRSYHIMLIGLKQPLVKGTPLTVTLMFSQHAPITVQAEVLDPWAMAFDDR